MKRILIWKSLDLHTGMNIFQRTDYTYVWKNVLSKNPAMNWGNKLWFQGIISEIDTPENELFFLSGETPDQINIKYDLIVYPMANIFGVEFCSDMTDLVNVFSHIKIPVYIIACGIQLKRVEEIDELIQAIGSPASRFIETIYNTGGEFALRGFFSKEFFSRLGYSSAVVTGCPSLFQLGRNFQMQVVRCSKDEIVPVINGDLHSFESILRDIPESYFISQDTYAEMLYNPDYLSSTSLRGDILFARQNGLYTAELMSEGRIRMFADMDEWYSFIRTNGFNYSFGKRIHGNVMSILAGIPATLIAIDVRTQEIAEFFDIPYVKNQEGYHYTIEDLNEQYNCVDYTEFNTNFKKRFDAYERFLVDHGIVSKINEHNRFFTNNVNNSIYQPNKKKFEKYNNRLKIEKPLLQGVKWLLDKKKVN